MPLVIVGGLNIIVEATRELKSVARINVCVETVRTALREAWLKLVEKLFKLALCAKNVTMRLEFPKMLKDWMVYDWKKEEGRRWFLMMKQGLIFCACIGLICVGIIMKRTF
jgi:hypothetical protein